MNNERAMFVNTMNEMGSHSNLSANECEKFGMAWGCKPDCPVFERGECKDVFAHNLESFIWDGYENYDDAYNALLKYTDRLTYEQQCMLLELIQNKLGD